MAKKSKARKKAERAAKKHPVAALIIVLLLAALCVGGYFAYRFYLEQNPETSFVLNGPDAYTVAKNSVYDEKGATATYNGEDVSSEIETSYSKDGVPCETVFTAEPGAYEVRYEISYKKLEASLTRLVTVSEFETASFSVSFLELGNKYTGDSVYVKAGDVDILIDAGSRQSSASAIGDFLRQEGNVEDGKLEYVIATHAHQDHIAGFVGTSSVPGIFDQFETGTIIDFAKTEATSSIYTNYVAKRDAEVAAGAKHYTALECYKESVEGAQRVYDLAPGITMEILYHKFYEETAKGNENDYSVALLFTQGNNHYLFTGDLEEEGEASLVEKNDLPEVVLFKGAHHGSYTANSDALLSVIKPKVVCICCCAGTTEFRPSVGNEFPAQAAINRLGQYTERIYVTSLWDPDAEDGVRSLNGTITCTSSFGNGLEDFAVHGSVSDTILKDTEWFKANRTWPTRAS